MGNIYNYNCGPISNKYDSTLDYHVTMYDNLPYKRNAELCGAQQLGMYSGHIVKYYLCINNEEKFKVNNQDDKIQEILAKIKSENISKISENDTEVIDNDNTDGITQEQIQTLLDDPEASEDNSSDNDAPSNAINAFEGVKDW